LRNCNDTGDHGRGGCYFRTTDEQIKTGRDGKNREAQLELRVGTINQGESGRISGLPKPGRLDLKKIKDTSAKISNMSGRRKIVLYGFEILSIEAAPL